MLSLRVFHITRIFITDLFGVSVIVLSHSLASQVFFHKLPNSAQWHLYKLPTLMDDLVLANGAPEIWNQKSGDWAVWRLWMLIHLCIFVGLVPQKQLMTRWSSWKNSSWPVAALPQEDACLSNHVPCNHGKYDQSYGKHASGVPTNRIFGVIWDGYQKTSDGTTTHPTDWVQQHCMATVSWPQVVVVKSTSGMGPGPARIFLHFGV